MTATPNDTHPLLVELEQARAELQAWIERRDAYDGNNPDKYQIDVQRARERVDSLERRCKDAGVIPKTPGELMSERLNQAYPDDESRAIRHFEGHWYMRVFSPVSTSISGKTVHEYSSRWDRLPDDHPAVQDLLAIPTDSLMKERYDAVLAVWPIANPEAGMRLTLRVGAPSVAAQTAKAPVGYDRGPVMRVKLLVDLTMTEAAMDLTVKVASEAAAQRRWAKGTSPDGTLLLSTAEDGAVAKLKKKGRGSAGLVVEFEPKA